MTKYKNIQLYSLIFLSGLLLTSLMVEGQTDDIKDIHNVLILGNSITRHEPNPDLDWYGDWGMAASAKEKDYVHDLLRKFQGIDPSVKFHIKTIVNFERSYWNYDFSSLDSLRNIKPDLIILHIGENVNSKMLDKRPFESFYKKLLNYFISDNPEVRIICTSTFWKQKRISDLMRKAAHSDNCSFIKISQLSSDSSNMAIGKFKNKGVAIHPSDAGMKAMADLLWQKIRFIYEKDQ